MDMQGYDDIFYDDVTIPGSGTIGENQGGIMLASKKV